MLKAHFYLDRDWQVQRGLEAAWRAEELRPADAEIKDLVGWGHYLVRDSQVAAEKLTQAIRLDPTLASAHYHLAVVYGPTSSPSLRAPNTPKPATSPATRRPAKPPKRN